MNEKSENAVKTILALLFTSVLLLIIAIEPAHAGTTGTEFQQVYQTIRDWTAGYLGRAIAMASFIVGLGYGIMKASPIIAVAGVAIAFFIMVGPNVLDAIASATI